MHSFARELVFAWRDRTVMATVVFAALLSMLTLWAGMTSVERQRVSLATLKEKTLMERQQVLSEQSDAGGAAYYTFHTTFGAPSNLAFAALGTRFELPWQHRIRMLALEGQIYEADVGNAELALVGRLDFAFVASVVLPLLVILLLYDLRAAERRNARFELLCATATDGRTLFRLRAVVRTLLLGLAMAVPFEFACQMTGASLSGAALCLFALFLNLVFWAVAGGVVTNRVDDGATAAATLLALWCVLVVAVPGAGRVLAERSAGVPNGGELLLTQRESVNDAWDLPKSATMSKFATSHPQWSSAIEVERPFEWKWYFAFQQVGDETVKAESDALRSGIARRDRVMRAAAWLSPTLLTERLFVQAAGTGVPDYLRYEQCVRDFHASLRAFHYPMLFGQVEFSPDELAALPVFAGCAH